MSNLDSLRNDLSQKFPNNQFVFENNLGADIIEVPKDQVRDLLQHFKSTDTFDFLMSVGAVDFPERQKRFDVVYEMFACSDARRLRIKTQVAEGEKLPSVFPVWKGANWFEREIYDMFGILFDGHPNMTRLLTHHQFVGHPLRKDYRADKQQHCTEALPIHFEDEPNYQPDPNKDLIPLNIGPSHPATHGTLRIMAEMDGETVRRSHVEIGYLHRCFEKMAETHPYNQVIPFTDRLNYCSAPINNVGYCKAVEKLLNVEIPPKAQAMRIVLCELSRIIDHIVCIAANAVDLGALTGFFHLFTYREKVYTLFEKLCGARLTVSMTRIGGMAQDAPEGWFDEVLTFVAEMRVGISEIETLLSGNKIWIDRTRDVGKISAKNAIEWGYTGPCLRATGVSLDLRKADPYYGYETLDFDIPVGTSGDVFDRYLVRVEEMKQSCRIIEQVCKNIPGGDYTIRDKGIVLPEKKDVYGNIEGLMNHFMLVINGLRPPKGEIYDATEGANGELGFYLVSDGSGNPYRLKVRPPCFAIYQSFSEQITGGYVADVVAILGSMNVIAGELDR
ncbi:MAG: NADH-quinone oxidoreductase subunit D [Bdellovibrionaceae bacterium]|nr:NADH-quinone oxidoreductase subunit D [Pseudobdellovibrionaceae bacterium]